MLMSEELVHAHYHYASSAPLHDVNTGVEKLETNIVFLIPL